MRWKSEYDEILINLHRAGHLDDAVTGMMLDQGYAVSKKDVGEARRRLGLRANNPSGPALRHQPLPKEKPNPIACAKAWLGKRLVEKPSGFWLDGRPVSVTTIMQTMNKMRSEVGMEQLVSNEAWRYSRR